ncbi:MAG: methyltransferase domain-containing protein [Pseudoxanthomonas sp.]
MFSDAQVCGVSLLVRLGSDETLVRCIRCRGTPIHLSMIEAIRSLSSDSEWSVCELSSRGALVRYLEHRFREVVVSEYFDGVESGVSVDGVRCEDVMALTYPNARFDLLTCTEVFEHVADDLAGFREVRRVLKDSGVFVFTVPMIEGGLTQQRARMENGQVRYLLEPAYHGDRLRGRGRVLVFRDYGSLDICTRLLESGFGEVGLFRPEHNFFGHGRIVVVARGRSRS